MKTLYIKVVAFFLLTVASFSSFAQQQTTVIPSSNCGFTYNFNSTDEGFSSPSIYSDANDFGLYWDGSQLAENSGFTIPRTASTISGIYFNTEANATTIGFDYSVPAGTEYRIRIISGVTNPPLEILATTANGPIWTSFPATSGSLCLELRDMDLPIGIQIRYEITFRAIIPGAITFDNFRRQSFNSALPVTFLGFIARETPTGSLNLLWNVGDEINVKGYEVQSSTDGINFDVIGFVNATGKDNYSLAYNGSVKGVRFFRVRNIDIDNKYKYTGIIKVQSSDLGNGIKLYPVPANDQIYLEHPKEIQKAMISIISSDGRVMMQIASATNSYQTTLNVGNLRAGIYFVKYDEGNGRVLTTQFVKN